MDDKLSAFKTEFEKEKMDMAERSEKALFTLQDSIDQLRCYQEEYIQLKAKYEQLQETHSKMRDKGERALAEVIEPEQGKLRTEE